MRGPRDSGTPQQSHTDELPEELEDTLGLLVRLSEHRLSCLGKDAAPGKLHHLLGHVDVSDARLRSSQVLGGGAQVVDGVLEATLEGAKLCPLGGNPLNGFVDLGSPTCIITLCSAATDEASALLAAAPGQRL